MTSCKNSSGRAIWSSRWFAGVWMAGTMALASSCQQDATGPDHPAPDHLCGTSVDPNLLETVLPSGAKVEQDDEHSFEGYTDCRVSVDGQYALSAVVYLLNAEKDPLTEVLSSRLATEYRQSAVDAGTIVWRGEEVAGATAAFGCAAQELGSQALLTVHATGATNGLEDPRLTDIDALAADYLENFRERHCQEG